MRNHGFTLIELLVASAIALLVLGLVASGIQSGSSATRVIQTQQQMLEDVRVAGNYIADTVASAVYVFPPGTTLTIGGNGYTSKNPSSNNNIWTVGTDPVIALITPPSLTNQQCKYSGSQSQDPSCYQFKAFYILNRGAVVTAATGAENPGTDPINNSRWMIYEYRENLRPSSASGGTWNDLYEQNMSKTNWLNPLPEVAQGALPSLVRLYGNNTGGGNLLADYIQPNAGFSLDFATSSCNAWLQAKKTLVQSSCVAVTGDPERTYSLARISLTLVAQKLGQQPATTPTLSFMLSPRNLAAFLKD